MKLSKYFKIYLALLIIVLSISAISYYKYYRSKNERNIPVPSEGVISKGSCPTGPREYNPQSNYPIKMTKTDENYKKVLYSVYDQIDNTDIFKRRNSNRTAKEEWVAVSGADGGYIEKIDISYSDAGKIESTEEQLRPKLETFIKSNGYYLGNPSLSDFQFEANGKTYTFSTGLQKVAGYPVKDSIINIKFVDGGITYSSGHWWRIDENIIKSLKIIPKDKILSDFSYTLIESWGPLFVVPGPSEKKTTKLDKNDFKIEEIYIIENDLCNNKNYDHGFFLVYEITANDSWKIYLDATNGKVIKVEQQTDNSIRNFL